MVFSYQCLTDQKQMHLSSFKSAFGRILFVFYLWERLGHWNDYTSLLALLHLPLAVFCLYQTGILQINYSHIEQIQNSPGLGRLAQIKFHIFTPEAISILVTFIGSKSLL